MSYYAMIKMKRSRDLLDLCQIILLMVAWCHSMTSQIISNIAADLG